jgi:hypothetical protein
VYCSVHAFTVIIRFRYYRCRVFYSKSIFLLLSERSNKYLEVLVGQVGEEKEVEMETAGLEEKEAGVVEEEEEALVARQETRTPIRTDDHQARIA